eukprot:TRINITY_DN6283_c0_g1_i1.p1 TRINITY_DN6283_c0_g1~~TRINITY_DN6283_c0_g1_i1.p1  ORF type:complete len:496 (+),score=158.18 TRINITY_DN6283_c0_g1_i1:79-1566(+)
MAAPPPQTRYEDNAMPGDVWSLAVLGEDGKRMIIAGGDNGAICRWDAKAFAAFPTQYSGHSGAVTAICPAEGGEVPSFFTASTDKTIRRWELSTGNCKVLDTCRDWVRCMVTAGDTLYVGGNDNEVSWYPNVNGETPGEHTGWPGHLDWVSCLLLNEGALYSGSYDSSIRQWDTASAAAGQPAKTVAVYRGHTGHVKGVAVTAQGQLISAGRDGTVRLWQGPEAAGGEGEEGAGGGGGGSGGTCIAVLNVGVMLNCIARVPEGSCASLVYCGGSDGVVRCVNSRKLKSAQEQFVETNRKALAGCRAEEEKAAKERCEKLQKRLTRQLKKKEGELRAEAAAEAAAAKPAEPAAEGADGEAPPAEGGGEEEAKVALTGALPEDHPKFQDMEKAREQLTKETEAERKGVEARLAHRIRQLEAFYIADRTYSKEGNDLASQTYMTELACAERTQPLAVHALCVREEAVPGQEGVTVPVVFAANGNGVARVSGKVTSRVV